MIAVFFNGDQEHIESIEAFSLALDRYNGVTKFELRLSQSPDGPSICMLRNGACAFLMY